MDIFSYFTDAFQGIFSTAWIIFIHGGWILFIFIAIRLIYNKYMSSIRAKFGATNKKVFLQIRVERLNLKSILAVEQIFAQLHVTQTKLSFANTYIEGQGQLGMSFEIVSIGGKINYIIQSYEKYISLVETAFYAQFPSAEITAVDDYMANLSKWDPLTANWDFWGSEYGYTKDYAYPIRTYKSFEHAISEEKILDPLAPMLEALSKIEPHELMAIQYAAVPMADDAWQPHVQDEIKKLKGEYKPPPPSLGQRLLAPIDAIASINLLELLLPKPAPKPEEKPAGSPLSRMTEGERKVLLAIEDKLSKPAWAVKMRLLYIAPKETFDNTKRTALIGSLRTIAGMTTNNLKPVVGTAVSYKLSKTLEQPYVDFSTKHKKTSFLGGFVGRVGGGPMIMNSEELATIFHFPLSTVTAPPVESVDVKKGQPPANLPIVG